MQSKTVGRGYRGQSLVTLKTKLDCIIIISKIRQIAVEIIQIRGCRNLEKNQTKLYGIIQNYSVTQKKSAKKKQNKTNITIIKVNGQICFKHLIFKNIRIL